MQAVLAHPENMALVKRVIGLEELVVPDEASRTKQCREVVQLEVILPSIMPDEFADNHAVERQICTRWFSSDAGQVWLRLRRRWGMRMSERMRCFIETICANNKPWYWARVRQIHDR
jgi:hypothetical protein